MEGHATPSNPSGRPRLTNARKLKPRSLVPGDLIGNQEAVKRLPPI
jgi:hypothetical protein